MKRIFKYNTPLDDSTLYTRSADKEHPLEKGEYPEEINYTRIDIMEFVINYRAKYEHISAYGLTQLKRMKMDKLAELANSVEL